MPVHLPRIEEIAALRPLFAAAAQDVYDSWTQDEDGFDEELGSGGICHLIADKIVDIICSHIPHDIRVASVCLTWEQHVVVMFAANEGVCELDIPYRQYETGGGFTWQKIPGVSFTPDFVTISRIDGRPEKFWDYTEDGPEEDEDLRLAVECLNGDRDPSIGITP